MSLRSSLMPRPASALLALTGDPSYLEPYKNAAQKLEPALLQLREAVASGGNAAVNDRTAKLRAALWAEIQRVWRQRLRSTKEWTRGCLPADRHGARQEDDGREIRSEVAALSNDLRASLSTGRRGGSRTSSSARLGMVTGDGVHCRASSRRLGARAPRGSAFARSSAGDRCRSRRASRASCPTARRRVSELSKNHLQTVREEEESRLAREIHDELGGILVGAKMDVAWTMDKIRAKDAPAAAKLRARRQDAGRGRPKSSGE